MINEADTVLYEDLEAAADYYRKLVNGMSTDVKVTAIAREQFGDELDVINLNLILQHYACTDLTLEQCVENRLRRAGLQ